MTELRGALLARQTFEDIKANPADWRQDDWRCATGMCFAGYVGLNVGARWVSPQNTSSPYVKPVPGLDLGDTDEYGSDAWGNPHVADVARAALESNGAFTDDIFGGDNDLEDLATYVNAMLDAERKQALAKVKPLYTILSDEIVDLLTLGVETRYAAVTADTAKPAEPETVAPAPAPVFKKGDRVTRTGPHIANYGTDYENRECNVGDVGTVNGPGHMTGDVSVTWDKGNSSAIRATSLTLLDEPVFDRRAKMREGFAAAKDEDGNALSRTTRLRFTTAILNRPVNSWGDLTDDELVKVVEAFRL